MSLPVFIGDEVSAQGYRLAGLQTLIPGEDDLLALVQCLFDAFEQGGGQAAIQPA